MTKRLQNVKLTAYAY